MHNMEDSPSDTDVSAIQSHAFLFGQNVAKKILGTRGPPRCNASMVG